MSSSWGSAGAGQASSLYGRLLRLSAVPGSEQHRLNDVLLLRPEPKDTQATCSENNAHVVFFPGDIQNFHQEMAVQPDASPWLSFSLERVALVLGARFPGRHVWLVRPSRLHLHKFSCYTNFVSCDVFGAPKHSPDYGAVLHLRALLGHAMERAAIAEPLPPLGGSSVPAPLPKGFSLILVAFSKGCVVLNQVVHELASVRTNPELRQFLDSISDMYWLDGGHPGTGDTWVTDKQALGELASSGIAVHAHVTPYEVCDPTRAWVGREHRCFVKTLGELGARISQNLHFEDEPACIANHFRVIEEF
ncbi:mitochondrial protein C2orf69 homolog isoform X2 [Neoarius graeffei]|nr:mitochondrial protein C2orf69 homolog isoform X2 [Neoarius graeffei]XP_060793274.1 mitochondrial protein C2orf69 homolog isoform X2 [Neoarius graeffei]XP_060793275.1 mitochondrial protein C2orf69 homolog isoform X2 [Neoarius graeffei]XP_060793276.1 mitochondrial protein C2orf69 homolog isoform X2 [Neoarius graeffei]XP_060793277.1 mitochondrial protein C2orf69 homolog isoform X2 [Neoarius graeffei]